MLLGGQKIDAETAYGFGLIDEVVDDKDVLARAVEICSDMAAADISVAQAIKGLCP
jgi:enoyl-CoA hydratase